MHRVKVWVADGQAAFQGHGAKDESGRQPEEAHCKAKQVAQSVTTKAYQGHVVGVADEHRWAEEAGSQQVSQGQTRHQDAEDRGPGAVLILMHSEYEESQQVSPHTSQKHDDACCSYARSAHNRVGVVA